MDVTPKRANQCVCARPSLRWNPGAVRRVGQAFLGLALIAVSAGAAAAARRQDKVLPVSQEPHHHLKLANTYVQVYRVRASRGDDILMHRHEYDMISIQTGPADTTVHYPDKPDLHRTIKDGQVRYQLEGLVHATQVNGNDPFRNVTIALLHPQTGKRNLCAAVIAGEPLECAKPPETTQGLSQLPEMQTDQTQVTLLTVQPRAEAGTNQAAAPEVLVALDEAEITVRAGQGGKWVTRTLRHPGDFAWLDAAGPQMTILNAGEKQARLVAVLLKR